MRMLMKYNKLIALVCFAMAFISCREMDDNEQHYQNKLFISAEDFAYTTFFKEEDTELEYGLKVAIAKPENHDIQVIMGVAPELFATYQQIYQDDTSILLPEEHYWMPETSVTIKSGNVTSPELPVRFTDVGGLDPKTTYVLPVTIRSVEGIDVLQSARTYYYIFRGASLVNVVCNISRNRAYPDFNHDSRFNNLSENTMEILFKATSFPNTLHTLMGIEGHYLLRIGDSGLLSNQLQVVASDESCTSTDLQLESGEWYHLAVTFSRGDIRIYLNGKEKLSQTVKLKSVSIGNRHSHEEIGSRCFWIGYSYKDDRYFDGVVSEVRIWNRALTAEEIQVENHFYKVSPQSEGLIAYWKFDEGSGKMAKDYSRSGYDLTIEKEPKWEAVSLPDDNP